MDCLFCKIIAGDIPSTKVYEDEKVLAFRDIAPQAKEHIIVIPKKHIASLDAAEDCDQELLGCLLLTCKKVACIVGIDKTGYRVITNIGDDGCQSVKHIHLHVLGGEKLSEKLG
ncbi:MAG: histidine triad nucleotide-binding protein [Clostridiales bacterium]|nr:histidine triad nucleotide-binding protein [Clostridiales bacterium]